MVDWSLLLPVLVGALQGVIEWLPISSEGGVSVVMTLAGLAPARAVRLALFLHAGTGLAALTYYRDEVWRMTVDVLGRPGELNWDHETSFVVTATVVSILVASLAYLTLLEAATALSGGAFIALIGALLVLTGLVQRAAGSTLVATPAAVSTTDSVLAGVGQGLAVLPGVSRSGMTVSVLLFRGHSGEDSFRLSFLLSIPAAFGAGLLAVVDTGGVPLESVTAGLVALSSAAVVGFLSIDALMRVVRRLPFWGVCVGIGSLAIVGGLVLVL